MATTGAVVHFKPTLSAFLQANQTTGAVLYFTLRLVSGIFDTGGSFTNTSAASAKSWLPPPRVPVTMENGMMTPEWYRFFRYIAEDRLGGASAPSIGDVQTTVGDTQRAVTTNVAQIANVIQAVNTNAQVTQTQTQVAQNSGLTGASQIPQPILVEPIDGGPFL